MVLDASDKIPRVSPYSGSHRASLGFRVRDFHPLRSGFPTCSTIFVRSLVVVLLPQPLGWFGLFPFRSPLLRESFVYFLFLQLLRCFSSLGFPCLTSVKMCQRITTDGFPHSDTPGSLAIYASPRLFAVNCVLLRLQVPRHPPYALYNLISSHISNVFSKYKELLFFCFLQFLLSYYLFLTIKKDNIYLLFGFQRTIF